MTRKTRFTLISVCFGVATTFLVQALMEKAFQLGIETEWNNLVEFANGDEGIRPLTDTDSGVMIGVAGEKYINKLIEKFWSPEEKDEYFRFVKENSN